MSDQPQGPDFVPPTGQQPQGWPPQQQPQGWPPPTAWTPPNQPQQGWAPPPGSWPPPTQPQQGWTPAGQQPGSPPQQPWTHPESQEPRRRRRWPVAVTAALLVGVVGVGALIAPSLLNRTTPAPAPTSAGVPLVTVAPSPQPADQTVLTAGGDLGAPATFTSSTGTGTLTITRATWTHAGRMAPPDGRLYLIVEVTLACSAGHLDVSSLSLRTTAEPAGQSAFGPELSNQFPGVRLSAGEKQSGQLGLVLPAGQVTVALLDPATLEPIATRVVPGP